MIDIKHSKTLLVHTVQYNVGEIEVQRAQEWRLEDLARGEEKPAGGARRCQQHTQGLRVFKEG